ncbi:MULTISPECIES: vWA domain-containing protein [unclassified Roseateles]|uniref:vWA domain-containing protein n=1 Tax=unclassified Roseateles TaxID=2626991 RepID=UPI001F2D1182|nr:MULTISPECIES: vWA domain-containing protein [unclassified Roseateles]
MRGALASLALATATFSASAAPTTQLGFLIDASGSIGTANFNLMRSGYISALGALPTDGSVEVTIYTFSTNAAVLVAPLVVSSAADITTITNALTAFSYVGGGTNTADGINDISAAMLGSGNYNAGLRSIINLATDGVPNSQADAIAAAAAARARGIDALTAEAIGTAGAAPSIAQMVFSPLCAVNAGCGVILPDGSIPTDPMSAANPWVLQVNNFADFPVAINAKLQAIIVNRLPEPGSLALVGLTLGLLGVARRSRKA